MDRIRQNVAGNKDLKIVKHGRKRKFIPKYAKHWGEMGGSLSAIVTRDH